MDSTTLIVALCVTYILSIIFLALLIYRQIIHRRCQTDHRLFCALWWNDFFTGSVGFFLFLHVGVATGWWVTDEKYTREYLEKMANWKSQWQRGNGSAELSPMPSDVDHIPKAVMTETGLALIYVCLMTCVQAAFLALIRVGYGKLRSVVKVFWWISVVVVFVAFVGLMGMGFAVMGRFGNSSSYGYTRLTIFALDGFVSIASFTQGGTLLLLLLTGSLSVWNFHRFIPGYLRPGNIIILFLPPVLSLVFKVLRIIGPVLGLWYHCLYAAEIFMLANLVCTVSMVVARAEAERRVEGMKI